MNKKILGDMFVNSDDGKRRCFRLEDMKKEAPNYPIYNAISDAMRESNLSFDFSYEVAEIACNILAEVDWNDEDAINEAVDNAVPVCTYEIMKIYADDSTVVDEAVSEYGNESGSSGARAKVGWYFAIKNMVQAIQSNLVDANAI